VRVIAKRSLQRFWERPGCANARGPLHSWYAEAIKANWRSPQDIKDQYASATNRAGFAVRCTATSSGIPARSFHHPSTSIENSRRVHNGQLSRSIAVYRFSARDL